MYFSYAFHHATALSSRASIVIPSLVEGSQILLYVPNILNTLLLSCWA